MYRFSFSFFTTKSEVLCIVLVFFRGAEAICVYIHIHTYMYLISIIYLLKREFIRSVYTTIDWIVPHGYPQAGRLGNPVAAQSKKLGASEQAGPRRQPQSEGEGLEATLDAHLCQFISTIEESAA
jgi:hypothetical protein